MISNSAPNEAFTLRFALEIGEATLRTIICASTDSHNQSSSTRLKTLGVAGAKVATRLRSNTGLSSVAVSELAYDLGQYLCDLGRAVRAGRVSCLDNATLFAL